MNLKQRLKGTNSYDFTDHSSIKILPICDLHVGSVFCNYELINKAVKYIEENDDCYTVFLGDITNNANLRKGHDGVWFQNMRPDEQEEWVIEKMKPIAHKIISVVDGNHGWAWSSSTGHNPDKRIALALDAPHHGFMAILDYRLGQTKKERRRWTHILHHGTGGGGTDGGVINSANKLLKQCLTANLITVGHFHRLMYNCSTSQIINNSNIYSQDVHIFVCGGSYSHITTKELKQGKYSNYSVQKNMSPTSPGFWILELTNENPEPGRFVIHTERLF